MRVHTHQRPILTEGRHLLSYFYFLSPRFCWLLSNREASFPGSGIGRREGVEGGGKEALGMSGHPGWGLSATQPPKHSALTGLRVMGVGGLKAIKPGRVRRDGGTMRGTRGSEGDRV